MQSHEGAIVILCVDMNLHIHTAPPTRMQADVEHIQLSTG